MKQLNELSKKEVIELYLKNIIEQKKIITPEIKRHLKSMGFVEKKLGCKKQFEINSKDLKVDFNGYDFAIGLAAKPENCVTGRKYAALVLSLNDNDK